MKTYAIFLDDCEIHLTLELGTLESVETARELIKHQMQESANLGAGYVESYPFFKGEWEIVGGKLPVGFDQSIILEVTQ
jgi:hypothetical protein